MVVPKPIRILFKSIYLLRYKFTDMNIRYDFSQLLDRKKYIKKAVFSKERAGVTTTITILVNKGKWFGTEDDYYEIYVNYYRQPEDYLYKSVEDEEFAKKNYEKLISGLQELGFEMIEG